MGFNDRLSLEHYTIMARNFRPAQFVEIENLYAGVLLGMHLFGAGLLISERRRSLRSTRWFFALQSVVFPLGWAALAFLPVLLLPILSGRMDREGFVDIPFFVATAQPVWVVVSLLIVLIKPGRPLGQTFSALTDPPGADSTDRAPDRHF